METKWEKKEKLCVYFDITIKNDNNIVNLY